MSGIFIPPIMSSSEPLVLINGSPEALVSPLDRGLAFGDGVFRTLRIEAGQPVWWPDHLAKLEHDCRQIALDPPNRSDWEQDIAWLGVRQADAVLKLMVSRGPGPRGYRLPDNPFPTRIAIASPMPDFPDPVAESGATLRVCNLRLGHQPRLAGVKHLNRLENVLARMEWDDPAIDEGLLLDTDGLVISGVMSNLFIRHAGVWRTPAIDRCGVAGVTRSRLLDRLGATEDRFGLDAVLTADAILLCNSLVRVRWVSLLGERRWLRPPDFDFILEMLCSEN
jgi:4-amino-4-deoxychorismate lyase